MAVAAVALLGSAAAFSVVRDDGGSDDAQRADGLSGWGKDHEPTVWPVADDTEAAVWQRHLAVLPELVAGSGFVAHRGRAVYRWGNDHHPHYVASAMKVFFSVLLLHALEQGLVDDLHSPVADVLPELGQLDEGRDGAITWHQLATMTSGYGVAEGPGEAYAYNDYAVQLFYDVLVDQVFGKDGDKLLLKHVAGPLGWEDRATFRAFGDDGPEPKMRVSARDLAKFGQWLLDGSLVGAAEPRPLLSPDTIAKLTSLAVDESVPMTTGRRGPMLPDQGTVGGGEPNLMTMGPGRYGLHLWHNRDPGGGRLIPDAPEGSLLAIGKLGESVLWVIPEWQVVIAWTNSGVTDQERAISDPDAAFNRVARRLAAAVAASGSD